MVLRFQRGSLRRDAEDSDRAGRAPEFNCIAPAWAVARSVARNRPVRGFSRRLAQLSLRQCRPRAIETLNWACAQESRDSEPKSVSRGGLKKDNLSAIETRLCCKNH